MVNHMGHYPLGAGPSRVDSLISEHEDNPNVEADELSSCIFNAPNVQVRLRNVAVLSPFRIIKYLSVLGLSYPLPLLQCLSLKQSFCSGRA